MSDAEDNEGKLAERQSRMRAKKRSGNPAMIVTFLIFMLLASVFIIGPGEFAALLGLGTSTSKEVQEVSLVGDSGINTTIRPRQRLDTGMKKEPEIVIRPPKREEPKPVPDRSAEYEKRIAELNKKIEELANQPKAEGGVSAKELKRLLAEQAKADREAAALREKLLKAELDAKLAGMSIPTKAGVKPEDEERKRRLKALEERRAAREAELKERLVSDGNIYDETEEGAISGSRDNENGIQDDLSSNEQFLKRNANTEVASVKARDLGDLSNVIVQGTILNAVLETAVDTELPGSMRAIVSNNVYSYDGNEILMPKGTRLIGTYNSDITIAQKRVFIVWTRAITPEGKSVTLAATGVDRLGRGGAYGNVDTRFFTRFGTAALITSITAIPTFIAAVSSSGNETSEAATDLASDVSDDLKDQTEDVLEEYLKLPPVIHIPQGTLVKVFVNQDLYF